MPVLKCGKAMCRSRSEFEKAFEESRCRTRKVLDLSDAILTWPFVVQNSHHELSGEDVRSLKLSADLQESGAEPDHEGRPGILGLVLGLVCRLVLWAGRTLLATAIVGMKFIITGC